MIFGGVSTRSFRAIIDGTGTYASAERDYETVEIAGRNGTLTIDHKRYRNVDISYNIFFYHAKDMEGYRSRITACKGYQRLEDSYHPEEYRIACLKGGINPKMHGVNNIRADVTVTFDCKPQRFLKAGEVPVTVVGADVLINPTGMEARPLIRVYGSGVLTIGDSSLTIAKHGQEYMDIDCDLQDCYCGQENLNGQVTIADHNFPVLLAGDTTVTTGNGIEKVIIWPGWWKL